MATEVEVLKAKTEKQAAALADADLALKEAAAYVEATQPELDKFAQFQDNFLKRAHQVAGALAERGVIQRHEVTALVDKLAEDPLRALDLVEKVAALVKADTLGKAADDVQLQKSAANLDPFEKLALYGDSRAEVTSNSGLVE
jgi:hypothetical protein